MSSLINFIRKRYERDIRVKAVNMIKTEIEFTMIKVIKTESIVNSDIDFLYVLDNELNNLRV